MLWLQLILKRGGREQGQSLALMICHKQKTESRQQLEWCPVTGNGWLSRRRSLTPLSSLPYSCHPMADPAPRIHPALHSAQRSPGFPFARCGERPELTRDPHVPTAVAVLRWSSQPRAPSWGHSRVRLVPPVLEGSRKKSQHRSMGDRRYSEMMCCDLFFRENYLHVPALYY